MVGRERYEDGRCKHCGSKYHCHKCKVPTSMMGHLVSDSEGDFYSCEERERNDLRLSGFAAEQRERDYQTYLRLKKKFEPEERPSVRLYFCSSCEQFVDLNKVTDGCSHI